MSLAAARRFALAPLWILLAATASAGPAQGPAAPRFSTDLRLGLVQKARGPLLEPALERVRDGLVVQGIRAEIVPLAAAPTKSKPDPAAPRFVLVVEKAEVERTGATTQEYEGNKAGQTRRVRWSGAIAGVTASLLDVEAGAGEVAEFVEGGDWTTPPKFWVFQGDEPKVEIEVPLENVLGHVLARAVRRGLAFAAAEELWPQREALLAHAASLSGEPAARFWERSAWVAAEYEPRKNVVPWRTLEAAALALWQGAGARAAAAKSPDGECAWCADPLDEDAAGECDCAAARALSAALIVLRATAERDGDEFAREKAVEIEVDWDELWPARPPAPKSEVLSALVDRVAAEHEADRALLRARLDGSRKPEFELEWYLVVTVLGPVVWEPADPDLVRHAAQALQGFPVKFANYNTYFDAKGPKPQQVLAKRRAGREYTAIEKREFKPEKLDALEAQVLRVLLANRTGKAPPR